MPPANESALWITNSPKRHRSAPGGNGSPPQLKFDWVSPAELERRLEDLAGHGRPPLVVVIDEGVEKPLRIARTVHRRFPLSQILFLVPPELLPSFRSELLRAPMIGTNWSVLEANSGDLSGELAVAARSSRQRRQFRTNLDAINLRLASPTPAPDSSEYRKLVISDKYLATILEHAEEAIVSLDGRGRVASWNRGATGSFGYSLNEALELSVTDLVIETDRKLLTSWFEEAAGGRAVAQRETTCLRQDGSTFNAEVTMAPVRDEEGETIAVSLIARDVTARKETEEQLRNIQAELEKRVIERTEDLRYLNAELEAFTYSASHDLRAPLRGIDGFSQALLEDYRGKLDATGVKYLERIRSGAQRMGEIIDALLLLSRISTARLSRRRVDIGRLSKEILRELSESEPTRSVDVEIESGLVVRADPQLLRIALQNLLGNAWKFTREREKASIRVGRSDDETFYVSDNGAGFDMAYAEKLFTPFQRIHHPSRFEGSGIGLGTVQRVMNRHGGKVWGLGEPDAGATFYFRLPDYGAEEGTRTGAGGTADVSVEVDGPRGQE